MGREAPRSSCRHARLQHAKGALGAKTFEGQNRRDFPSSTADFKSGLQVIYIYTYIYTHYLCVGFIRASGDATLQRLAIGEKSSHLNLAQTLWY